MIVDELFPIYGAIAGDMIGAPYELKGTRIKDIRFPIVKSNSLPTDDTIQTVAMMKWVTTREFESEDLVDILKDINDSLSSCFIRVDDINHILLKYSDELIYNENPVEGLLDLYTGLLGGGFLLD